MTTAGLADARRAWYGGDAERTLALCDALERDERTATESALLRARVYLRMQRADDARVLLAPLLPHTTGDDAVEVRALLGTAYARSGDVDRGLMLLAEANASATSAEMRAEIALGVALAHYARDEFAGAEATLDTIDSAAGLTYARALECRGWIAKRRGAFEAAVSWFEAALAELDRSPQLDRFLEANLIMALGNYAVELLDAARWNAVERRAERVDWDGAGMSYYRFWHRMNVSMSEEIAGRPREAMQAARSAALTAPTNAFRTFAHCRRAAVLLAYDELLGYADLAATIREEFEAIDLSALRAFEEINLAAVVVATLAQIGDAQGAAAAFARLRAMSPAQLAVLTDEPLRRGYFAYVEGLVADANHDAFTAQHRFREAFRTFRTIGMARRARRHSLISAPRLATPNAARSSTRRRWRRRRRRTRDAGRRCGRRHGTRAAAQHVAADRVAARAHGCNERKRNEGCPGTAGRHAHTHVVPDRILHALRHTSAGSRKAARSRTS